MGADEFALVDPLKLENAREPGAAPTLGSPF